MVIKEYYREPFSKRGILSQETIDKHAQDICDAFDVRSGEGILSHAGKLSGGNQQKAIVGREMALEPDLIIAVQPTRGLDVGAIEYIHKRLVEHRDKGKAVLLVSFELDEIFNLSDRIAVMNSGELIDIVETKHTNEEEVGLMMAGVRNKEAAL
jgi:simple sugar transport system ATP-binding protein